MLRLRRAIVLLCLLAASMPMLLPFAFAARGGGDGTSVQVLCTTHGTMWLVVDDAGGSPEDSARYVQGAVCPLCAAGAHAGAAPGPAAPPALGPGQQNERAHRAPVLLSIRHPWRLLLAPRAPPTLA